MQLGRRVHVHGTEFLGTHRIPLTPKRTPPVPNPFSVGQFPPSLFRCFWDLPHVPADERAGHCRRDQGYQNQDCEAFGGDETEPHTRCRDYQLNRTAGVERR
jgi:hypothetical protein